MRLKELLLGCAKFQLVGASVSVFGFVVVTTNEKLSRVAWGAFCGKQIVPLYEALFMV